MQAMAITTQGFACLVVCIVIHVSDIALSTNGQAMRRRQYCMPAFKLSSLRNKLLPLSNIHAASLEMAIRALFEGTFGSQGVRPETKKTPEWYADFFQHAEI
jgi:hypothetical protein